MPVSSTLQRGSRGPDVLALQTALVRAGFVLQRDGAYGPRTAAAVAEFQSERGLPATGIADLATISALTGDDFGVDVSQWSGVPDYGALFAEGYRFLIPRIGTGVRSVDSLAEKQIAAAKPAGFKTPAGYFYVQSARDGAAQADHAVETAKAFGLPAVFPDIEPAKPKAGDAWPVATDAPSIYREVAIAHLDRLLVLGFPFGVYGGLFLASLNLPDRFAGVVFWDAAYGPRAHAVKPFGEPALWQYQGNVKVAGAVVDCNRAFGGLAAFRKAMGTG